MKRIVPFAIGLILIGLLVVFNKRFNNGTEPSEEELAQQQAQAQQAAKKPAPPPPAPPSGPPAPGLPSDEVLGNPGAAKYKIVYGYTVDETTQSNTKTQSGIVNAVRAAVKGRPDVSAVIADVDVPAEDRAAPAQAVTQKGLTVNGIPTDPAKLSAALKH